MGKLASFSRMTRHAALFLALFLLAAFFIPVVLQPAAAYAQESGKTVRVGWYESPYNTVDSSGRRTGYAYEYQLKIAAYTGWNYEYVTGTWTDLLQMLIDGEIDLMSDISYTEERAKQILYPDLPMGTEDYYLFISPENRTIKSSDLSTLNGKRIGIFKDSVQVDFYRDWAKRNGVEAELIELASTEDELLNMVEDGSLDGFVQVDSFTEPERAKPVCKIGSSDFFFAVNNRRPDLLVDLNQALSKIRDENRYYNQQMFERYINTAGSNAFLTPEEEEWLADHGTIRVGYQDDYLAFCARNPETGELTGALKDFLDHASSSLANASLSFEAKAYPTMEDALAALKRGELDCVFPANMNGYEGEELGVIMTSPLMRTDMFAIVRQANLESFARQEKITVAVNEGNPNYDAYLLEHYPNWQKAYYPKTSDCLKAVARGDADCVLISGYRYNNLARQCDKYNLTTFPIGEGMDYCFAVNQDKVELYSILSKAIEQVPESTINSALSVYISQDARTSLTDFISDNLAAVMAVIAVIVLVILFFLFRSIRTEKKAKLLIAATEIDDLTGLYNRDYFFQYANRMRREHPDTPRDAIVLNIEQFHRINALNGREFGDEVLRTVGREARLISQEENGIAGRFGADRFDIYCDSGMDYRAVHDRLQGKLDDLASNVSIRLRMGVALWQEELEPIQLFDRARTACSMARGSSTELLIIFDESMRERELFDQQLLNDLRPALDNDEFEVYYQPKFDIQDDPPKLVSAEALIRWQHPQLGQIPPDDFVPLLERNGLIGEVDKFVWSQASRQIVRWQKQFGVTIPVSVNLSRVDVFDPTLAETLDSIIQENALTRDMLKLEVTESEFIENAEHLIQVARDLRKRGYTIEMDDFGAGYSSLNMLSSMPVDVLKVDRAFVRNIEHSEKDFQLVALILGIAENLKIPVVAEGVETERQVELLKNLGCPLVQGYYFSQPLHHSEFEATFLEGMSTEGVEPNSTHGS